MSVAGQTTSNAPSLTYDAEAITKRKRSLPLNFSWLWKYPLLSSVIISMFFLGIVAGAFYRSHFLGLEPDSTTLPTYSDGIRLYGSNRGLDLGNRTVSIEWNVDGCGAYTKPNPKRPDIKCDTLDRAVDIYMDGDSEPTFSYDPARFPRVGNEALFLSSLAAFSVDHNIHFLRPNKIPFDEYELVTSAFAVEKATNKSVPIAAFGARETANNFVLTSSGFSAAANFTYDPGTGPITEEVESPMIVIVVKWSKLAKGFTMCLFFINWALTTGSIYITIVAVSTKGKMDSGVLILPVTIVLTVPSLRGFYIGSPPFGIYIDTFGFVLQMIIVAVCSVILLCTIGSRSAHGGNEPPVTVKQ